MIALGPQPRRIAIGVPCGGAGYFTAVRLPAAVVAGCKFRSVFGAGDVVLIDIVRELNAKRHGMTLVD